MFKIKLNDDKSVSLSGRLNAANKAELEAVFGQINCTAVVDFKNLDYISSAGLGVLLNTQKRLNNSGYELRLINMDSLNREIFRLAGFDTIFTIE